MKSPKLLCSITLFLLFQLSAVEAQVVTTPRLTSTLGDGPTITVCESDTVTFTATGDSGPTPLQASFSINRRGTIIYPYGPSPQPITTFAINWLEDGDIVSARVWTLDNGGGNALTNSISVGVDDLPSALEFDSDAPNNAICSNEVVTFTATSTLPSTIFHFFINGISIQGPSPQSTFSNLITSNSTVTLIANSNSCEQSTALFIKENVLLPGSITGGGQFCLCCSNKHFHLFFTQCLIGIQQCSINCS